MRKSLHLETTYVAIHDVYDAFHGEGQFLGGYLYPSMFLSQLGLEHSDPLTWQISEKVLDALE